MAESELDSYFEHFVNGKEVLSRSLKILSEKMKMDTVELKKEKFDDFENLLAKSKRKKVLPVIKSKQKLIGGKKA